MPSVPLVPVKSSVIQSVAHAGTTLFVKFHKGKLFRFSDVPVKLYQDLLDAESVGRFFGAHVRGKFRHQEME